MEAEIKKKSDQLQELLPTTNCLASFARDTAANSKISKGAEA